MSRPPRRARLPFAPAHHCWSCGDPIDPHQAVGGGGVCRRLECQAAEVRRRQAEDRAIEADRRTRARDRLAMEGIDPGTASWSVVPANDAPPVSLSPERRAAFLEYLCRIVEDATHDGSRAVPAAPLEPGPGNPDPPSHVPATPAREDGRSPPPGPVEAPALRAGCAACRGWCCRQGGTHAFLTAERIARLLRERPGLTPDDIVRLYASHLEAEHLRGGCVFQGEHGCRLPRELRGDRCNEYYCPDLVQARRQWRARDGGDVHHFAAIAPRAPGGAAGVRGGVKPGLRIRSAALPVLGGRRTGRSSSHPLPAVRGDPPPG